MTFIGFSNIFFFRFIKLFELLIQLIQMIYDVDKFKNNISFSRKPAFLFGNHKIISNVSQDSVFNLIFFMIYINDQLLEIPFTAL